MPFERDPKPPVVGELRIELGVDSVLLGTTAQPMTATMCADEQEWQKELARLQAETYENIKAARNAWAAGDRSVPFPDYWAGWQAATLLINERAELEASKLREATLAGQLNAALQPTLDGEAFKKLRLQRDDALHEVATLRELVPTHVEKAFERASNRRTALENALYAFGFSVTWGAGDKLTVEREESDDGVL